MNYRKTLIKIITFLGGIYFFLEFVLPEKIGDVAIGAYHDQVSLGVVAVGAMAVGLGLINLLAVHGSKLLFKKKGWFYSAALLAGLFVMSTIMLCDWRATMRISKRVEQAFILRDFAHLIVKDANQNKAGVPDKNTRTEALKGATEKLFADVDASLANADNLKDEVPEIYARLLPNLKATRENRQAIGELLNDSRLQSLDNTWYEDYAKNVGELAGTWQDVLNIAYEASYTKRWYTVLYEGLFLPLGAAMFSLLGFYVASAAYRAFRVRSTESALMMLAAVIVMLGQIPFGVWLYHSLPEWRFWLLQIPSTAAFRAIDIGASIGWLVMAFRMWLSIESESFSKGK